MSSVPPPPPVPTLLGPGELLERPEAGPIALRGSVLRTGGYVAGILLSLASAPLLIRHLGVSDFGRYITVLSLVTVVSGVTEGGLNAVVLREYASGAPDARRNLMRSAVGVRMVMTFAGVLLAVVFATVAGYRPAMIAGTAAAGLALILQLLQSLLSVALQSELRFGWASFADLLRQLVNVVILVALVLAGAGLLPLLAAAAPASAASLAFTIWLVRGQTAMRPTFHLARWWPLLRDSVPWAAISAVNIVYFRVVIILMSLVATTVQTGYLATSFRIVEVLVGVPVLVISAAFPILARSAFGQPERFAYTTRRLFELSLLTGTWMVVGLEVAAPFAMHVLAAHRADPAIAVLRIQGLALVATFVAVAAGFPLLTLRRYRGVLLANVAALLSSAALTLALVPSLGARGGALTTALVESGLAIAIVVMLIRAAPELRLPLGAVPIAALAGGSAVAVALALPVHPLIGVVVASGVYLAALRLLGRFPPEARELLAGRSPLSSR